MMRRHVVIILVPILPELLREEEIQPHDDKTAAGSGGSYGNVTLPNSTATATAKVTTSVGMDEHNNNLDESCLKQLFHLQMLNENSQLGILFSTKVNITSTVHRKDFSCYLKS